MRFVSIYGPPGAGKTSVAMPLAKMLDAAYISSGDIARRVDPEALARGAMADRKRLREGFVDAILDAARSGARMVVVDGLPRDPTDCELLPDDTEYVLLTAKPKVLIQRQIDRAREGDTVDIINARTEEQIHLLQLRVADGWAYRIADAVIDTTKMDLTQMLAAVEIVVPIDR
jgi:adenylate kinase family enzyme